MKGAAWLTGLAALVLTVLWTVSPVIQTRRLMQGRTTASPEIDGYTPGHRAVWATEAPLETLIRPTDRHLDVVTPGRWDPSDWPLSLTAQESPLETAPRHASLVLVLTVTDLESAPVESADVRTGQRPRFETRRVFARVDEVIKNRSARAVLAGTSIVFSYEGGGGIEIGGTRVVTRFDLERLPERGRQYLWFLGATRAEFFGGTAANAFDIGGRRLTPLARRPRFAQVRQFTPKAALDLVRQRATLPDLREYESASGVHRGRIVHQPMRMAQR